MNVVFKAKIEVASNFKRLLSDFITSTLVRENSVFGSSVDTTIEVTVTIKILHRT